MAAPQVTSSLVYFWFGSGARSHVPACGASERHRDSPVIPRTGCAASAQPAESGIQNPAPAAEVGRQSRIGPSRDRKCGRRHRPLTGLLETISACSSMRLAAALRRDMTSRSLISRPGRPKCGPFRLGRDVKLADSWRTRAFLSRQALIMWGGSSSSSSSVAANQASRRVRAIFVSLVAFAWPVAQHPAGARPAFITRSAILASITLSRSGPQENKVKRSVQCSAIRTH